MLYEILTSPPESLLDLSRSDLDKFVSSLKEFYERAEKINNFDVRVENSNQDYNDLLQRIPGFCERTKVNLGQHIAYLRSKKVEQLEKQVRTTLADIEERFNTTISTETEKLQKLGEEAQQQTAEIIQKLEETHLKYQTQLTDRPISHYKKIFETQAKKHSRMAWVWAGVSGLLAIGFGIIFWELLMDIGSLANRENQLSMILSNLFLEKLTDIGSLANRENQLSMILSNLFAKGFYLSLIFLFLNRTIKNFAAEKHLEVINTHRQNALETFKAFVDAAEGNRETRDAVLLAATKAIFDANQSGYLSTRTSGADNTSPVQQIIREVSPTKSADN